MNDDDSPRTPADDLGKTNTASTAAADSYRAATTSRDRSVHGNAAAELARDLTSSASAAAGSEFVRHTAENQVAAARFGGQFGQDAMKKLAVGASTHTALEQLKRMGMPSARMDELLRAAGTMGSAARRSERESLVTLPPIPNWQARSVEALKEIGADLDVLIEVERGVLERLDVQEQKQAERDANQRSLNIVIIWLMVATVIVAAAVGAVTVLLR